VPAPLAVVRVAVGELPAPLVGEPLELGLVREEDRLPGNAELGADLHEVVALADDVLALGRGRLLRGSGGDGPGRAVVARAPRDDADDERHQEQAGGDGEPPVAVALPPGGGRHDPFDADGGGGGGLGVVVLVGHGASLLERANELRTIQQKPYIVNSPIYCFGLSCSVCRGILFKNLAQNTMEDIKDGSHHVPQMSPDDVSKHKVMAAIGYVSILCFVPLLGAPKSSYAKFHGKQGLVLFLTAVIIGVIQQILPGLWGILALANLGLLVLSVMGIVKAAEGQLWEMPVLGQFAKKFTF